MYIYSLHLEYINNYTIINISSPENLFKAILNNYVQCLKRLPFPHFAWPNNNKLLS